MESIGVLLELDTLITGSQIELFGLLSQSRIETEQECHFCMEPINKRCCIPPTRHVATKRYIAGVLRHGPIHRLRLQKIWSYRAHTAEQT